MPEATVIPIPAETQIPAIVVTHDATQTADYSGGDTNETMQSNK